MSEEKKKNEEVVTPEDIEKEIPKTPEELEDELNKVKKENGKYYEHLQRTAAEFDNYKKRVMKERENVYSLAIGDVIFKYIPILDNLEKAVNAETTDEKMREGVSLIVKQMLDVMTSLGVEAIPTVNETFNPEFHDAVMHIEDANLGEKIIVEELRKGYKRGDRVLRHAMVKVAN